MITIVLKFCGGLVIVGVLFAGWRFGWGPTLSFGGLLLDIVGAHLLALGGLLGQATYSKTGEALVRGDKSWVE